MCLGCSGGWLRNMRKDGDTHSNKHLPELALVAGFGVQSRFRTQPNCSKHRLIQAAFEFCEHWKAKLDGAQGFR